MFTDYLRKGAAYVEGGYNEIDPGLNPGLQDHYRITPSPGGQADQYGLCLFVFCLKIVIV